MMEELRTDGPRGQWSMTVVKANGQPPERLILTMPEANEADEFDGNDLADVFLCFVQMMETLRTTINRMYVELKAEQRSGVPTPVPGPPPEGGVHGGHGAVDQQADPNPEGSDLDQ